MTTIAIPFNILGCFERLKDAGIPEKHAMAQAEVLQSIIQAYDEKNRAELATKGDIADVRSDLRETELRLQKEILQSKHEMIKWYIGMAIAQTGVLAALYAIMK